MAEYISKQDVIDYLNGYLHSLGEDADTLFNRGQRRALTNSIQDILAVEAAEIQPVKHGTWLKASKTSWNNYKCSLCNTQYVGMVAITFTYCPDCGAKMDGEQNE